MRYICATTGDALLRSQTAGDLFWELGECSRTGEHSRLWAIILPAEVTAQMLNLQSSGLLSPVSSLSQVRPHAEDAGGKLSQERELSTPQALGVNLDSQEQHFSWNKFLSKWI